MVVSQTQSSAAVLTPPGRGAVATIAVSGNLAALQQRADQLGTTFFTAVNGRSCEHQRLNQIVFGRWGAEELVFCRIAEDEFELHCHGGAAATQRIIADLGSLDVIALESSEWLCQRFEDDSKIVADFTDAVAMAKTFSGVEWIWRQRQLAVEFWQTLERRLNEASPYRLDSEDRFRIAQARQWVDFGLHLTEPWSVVIAGPPNVGKSSLINALLGFERAIVFDQPGTTRDVVTAETAISGWPVLLSDTAGQRETAEPIEQAGIELATQVLAKADAQVLLIDQSLPVDPFTEQLLKRFDEALIVFNKSDLPQNPDVQRLQTRLQQSTRTVCHVSCSEKTGLDELLEILAKRLVPELPDPDLIFPVTASQRELLKRAQELTGDLNEPA